jgi:hypothetical protein
MSLFIVIAVKTSNLTTDSGDNFGVVGGMIGRGNGSTRRKPVLLPLCPY